MLLRITSKPLPEIAPTICVVIICAALSSTGCKTMKMPGMKMFGFNSEPDPAVLAGEGPTTTYPVPPGDEAMPSAINSIAGGTSAPAQPTQNPSTRLASAAGMPGHVSTAGPSMAAAQANGIYPQTQPAGFQSATGGPMTPPAATMTGAGGFKSPGYTFGSNTKDVGSPKMPAMPSGSFSANQPTMSAPSTFASSGMDKPKTNQFANTSPGGFSGGASAKESAPSGGFSLPKSGGLDLSKSSGISQSAFGNVPASTKSFAGDASSAESATPTVDFANLKNNVPAESTTPSAVTASKPSSSYMPGSTSGSGYPSATAPYPGAGYVAPGGGSTFR